MTRKSTRTLGAIFVLIWSVSALAADLKIAEPKGRNRNIPSERLAGNWVLDEKLSRRFDREPHGPFERETFTAVEFKSDPAVLAKLPATHEEHLKDFPIYMAGWMTRELGDRKTENPFLLGSLEGNPILVYFRGEGFDNSESFHVMLAPAYRKDNDLLFIGGDQTSEPFRAFSRADEGTSEPESGPATRPAERGDMPPELAESIREAVRLIEAEDFEGLIKRFMAPDELKEIVRKNELAKVARELAENKKEAQRILTALKAALRKTPEMSEKGTKARFEGFKEGDEEYPDITFKLIDGKWYAD